MLTPNSSHRFQIYEKQEQAIQSREGEKKNMKGSFLLDSQWIRKQWRSRGCSCVKTSGWITTMPPTPPPSLSAAAVDYNWLCITWTLIHPKLSYGLLNLAVVCAADCWQRAVASNLPLPIGAARKRLSEREGVYGGVLQKKNGLSCTQGLRLSLEFDIGLIKQPPFSVCFSVFSKAVFPGSESARSKRIKWHNQVPNDFCHATEAGIFKNQVANLSSINNSTF